MTDEATARAIVDKCIPNVIIATSHFDKAKSMTVDVSGWKDELKKAFAAALAAERERVLARLYSMGCSVQVANLCDEELDRSGALLGRVREQAAAIRKGDDAD